MLPFGLHRVTFLIVFLEEVVRAGFLGPRSILNGTCHGSEILGPSFVRSLIPGPALHLSWDKCNDRLKIFFRYDIYKIYLHRSVSYNLRTPADAPNFFFTFVGVNLTKEFLNVGNLYLRVFCLSKVGKEYAQSEIRSQHFLAAQALKKCL